MIKQLVFIEHTGVKVNLLTRKADAYWFLRFGENDQYNRSILTLSSFTLNTHLLNPLNSKA